jgi:hypothetical protein
MAQSDGIHLFFEGREVTEDDVKEGSHTLYFADRPEPEVHVFGSESALLDWANLRQDWTRVAHMLGTEQLVGRQKGADIARAAKLHKTRYGRLREDLDALSEETGLEGLELLRRATVGAPAFEGPASHSAFLHAPPAAGSWLNFAWMPRWIPIPEFSVYGMNDRGNLLTFFALPGGSIYENPWFGGRRLWFWGVSFGTDLRPFGFAGIASSGWSS